MITLIEPTMEHAAEIAAFRQELLAENASFDGCSGLQKFEAIADWLAYLKLHQDPKTIPEGKVLSTTYIALRAEDQRMVGIIDLRHSIDHPILKLWGGHIGYSVRPGERRKGYAKEMLRQVLQPCRDLGLTKVMVTCYSGNVGSERTILANGGVLEKEIIVDGQPIKRYWITL